jgi:hypothetical protein
MNSYTIVKDGQIDRVINCKAAYINMQIQVGETCYEGKYPSTDYRFINGIFMLITEDEKQFIPSLFKPTQQVLFDLVQQMIDSGLHIPIHTETGATKKIMKQAIDQAAGRTRARFVSPGIMIGEEYEQALRQAIICANSQGETIPQMMQTWANALNTTPLNAAMNILETAAQWEYILNTTYELRLSGKAAVDAASQDDFKTVALIYINQLDQIR